MAPHRRRRRGVAPDRTLGEVTVATWLQRAIAAIGCPPMSSQMSWDGYLDIRTIAIPHQGRNHGQCPELLILRGIAASA